MFFRTKCNIGFIDNERMTKERKILIVFFRLLREFLMNSGMFLLTTHRHRSIDQNLHGRDIQKCRQHDISLISTSKRIFCTIDNYKQRGARQNVAENLIGHRQYKIMSVFILVPRN